MKLKLALIAAVAGSMLIPVASAPASARTIMLQPHPVAPAAGQRWHGGGNWNRGGYNRGWQGGYRRGNNWGPALGGLAAGAIIGGALAAQAAPPPYYYGGPVYDTAPVYEPSGPDDVAYCMQQFRSYDPMSGTYLGYDGLRHPCP
jgi:hypothetical protein